MIEHVLRDGNQAADVLESDLSRRVLGSVNEAGFCLVKNIDPEQSMDVILALGRGIGHPIPMRDPEAERGFIRRVEVVSPDGDETPYDEYSRHAMECHTDGASREWPYEYVLMCCVASDESGGETHLLRAEHVLDGLSIAEQAELRTATFPFESGRLPLLFGDTSQVRFRYHRRELKHWAEQSGDEVPLVAAKVAEAVQPERCRWRFRLEVGDCLVLDNHRMLHGRSALPSTSGRLLRQLRVAATT